jgi:hypothetical protein
MPKALRLRVALISSVIGLLLALGAFQQFPAGVHAAFEDTDGDGAIDIAEQLTGSDPNSASSLPEDSTTDFLGLTLRCSDFADNDGDGLADGEDDGCLDQDGDVVSNGLELHLGSDPFDQESLPEHTDLDTVLDYLGFPVLLCADGVDNDGDGDVDGDDSGCAVSEGDSDGFLDAIEKRYGSDPGDSNSVPEHETPNPGSCSDGVDNDGDGAMDAADDGCGTPANDTRAGATVIGALPFSDGPRVIKNASVESGEPRSNCAFAGRPNATVWYSITPSTPTVVIADTDGSNFRSILSVWRQEGSQLREVTCDVTFLSPAHVTFRADVGVTYFIQIDILATGPSLPAVVFNAEAGTPPPNDDFVNAAEVGAIPYSNTVDMESATMEANEPFMGCAFSRVTSTAWYTFTPSQDGIVVADTAGSAVDTVLEAWRVTIFGLIREECSNDFGESPAAKLALDVIAGETYYFQLGYEDFSPTEQGFSAQFSLTAGVPPANDDIAGAMPVTLPFNGSSDALTASLEPDEPTPPCIETYYEIEKTLWFRFTAASDSFVVADTGFDFESSGNNFIGVYQGTSAADLEAVACGAPDYPTTDVGFAVQSGESYLIQLGSINYRGGFEGGIPGGAAEPAGFSQQRPLTLNIRSVAVPSCPSATFSVDDPPGDTFGFDPPGGDTPEWPDIVRVSGASTTENFCMTVDFAGPIDPPGSELEHEVYWRAFFDIDNDPNTGFGGGFGCPSGGRGFESSVYLDGDSGALADIDREFGPSGDLFGIALIEERSLTIIIPLDAIGDDDRFAFFTFTGSERYEANDCAPNGGMILSPTPAQIGDANCDGSVNAIDATLMLQLFAGLTFSLPCAYVADVNQNGGIGPIDAVLVLQYGTGLLTEWPPPSAAEG